MNATVLALGGWAAHSQSCGTRDLANLPAHHFQPHYSSERRTKDNDMQPVAEKVRH